MSSVTLPSSFDVNKITVTVPKVNEKTGAKSSYLNYGGEKLVMQTATQMVLPFGLGVFDKNGTAEYSVELSFRGMQDREALQQYHNALQALDDHMIKLGVKNSKVWFKSELNEQVIRAFYTPTLKLSKDKEGNPLPYPPTTKAKLRKINGDFEAKFFDESGTPYRGVPVEDLLVKGATATGLLECTGVWFAGSKYGLTWKVKQMIIHHLPQKMKDFAFVGFDPSEQPRQTTATSTMARATESSHDETALVDEDEVFESAPVAKPASSVASVVAAVMPSAAAGVPESVADDDAEDMEPVPVPVRKPIIKKKVVASVKK